MAYMTARFSAGGKMSSATATALKLTHLARLSLIAVCALAAGCASLPSREESFEPQTIHFDSSELGKLPPDFSTALTGGGGPVSWVIRADSTAPDGQSVLIQESADATNYRFPLCIYDKTVARDVAVEVNYKAISGTLDQAGGIVLRYTPENYYIARANALENNVILFKTVKGKRSRIKEVPVKVTAGQWHTLRFEAKGRRLTISFDGNVVIDRDDRTFSNPGQIGLWTKADSVSSFANLKIERAP
jgi:Domain of Unknown Function (DUF1080)